MDLHLTTTTTTLLGSDPTRLVASLNNSTHEALLAGLPGRSLPRLENALLQAFLRLDAAGGHLPGGIHALHPVEVSLGLAHNPTLRPVC